MLADELSMNSRMPVAFQCAGSSPKASRSVCATNARGASNRGLRQAALLAHPGDELENHRRPEGAGILRAYDACLAEVVQDLCARKSLRS